MYKQVMYCNLSQINNIFHYSAKSQLAHSTQRFSGNSLHTKLFSTVT